MSPTPIYDTLIGAMRQDSYFGTRDLKPAEALTRRSGPLEGLEVSGRAGRHRMDRRERTSPRHALPESPER